MPRGICKLCLLEKDLRRSHLMPAGVYRRDSPDSITVTAKKSYKSSEQITAHVFCDECEDRFDKNGENYVVRLISSKTAFPLLESLKTRPYLKLGNDFRGYADTDSREINRDAIAYFALSIFWRASVHRWKWRDGKTTGINLGPKYNADARLYLLGQAAFPKYMTLFVVLCSDQVSQQCSFMPNCTGRHDGCWTYSFGARGLVTIMTVGKAMPLYAQKACCVSSPEKWIWSRDAQQDTLNALRKLTSTPGHKRHRTASKG